MQARRITVLALLAGLTLAGCGEDEPEPKVEPPASSTPTPSPTAPVEPTLPPAAEGTSKAAAEAFVRHFYRVVDHAQRSGSIEALTPLGLASCDACNGGNAALENIFKAGGTITGGEHEVLSSSAIRLTRGVRSLPTRVDVLVATTRQVVRGTGTEMDREYEPGKQRVQFRLIHDSRGWRVESWEQLS